MLTHAYDLDALTAQLGTPAFEQTTKRGDGACLLVHWGCGCTAIGSPARRDADGLLRWTRCDHHALAEAPALA
jgi:hypothetical protein